MIAALSAAILLVTGQSAGSDMAHPKWTDSNWTAKDPFGNAWTPYDAALRAVPGYVEKSGWPEKARSAIRALGAKPTAQALYRAAACYLVASDLDWRFDVDPARRNVAQRPNSSALWVKLFTAWVDFPQNPRSKEFSRLGFAVCSPSFGPALDAGELPQALLKAFPKDRLVISSLVWYSRAGNRPLIWKWRTWVVDEARILPTLPDCRPQDYLTLATAFEARHLVKDVLPDAVAYRDNLLRFMNQVPKEDARRFNKALSNVVEHIKQMGG